MAAYVAMGCRATWTCAPYQLPERPAFGAHVAWAESNAIVFANSVLGARTDRYGDFLDICCAITGRAPAAGLHLDEPRRARVVFRLRGVAAGLLADEAAHAALGHLVGRAAEARVPAIDGLPPPPVTTEDHLKALGAAAASSGSVAMFHAVGITPEAPSLAAATGGGAPEEEVTFDFRATCARAATSSEPLRRAVRSRRRERRHAPRIASPRSSGWWRCRKGRVRGAVLPQRGARCPGRGRASGLHRSARSGRRHVRVGHLHVPHADRMRGSRPRHDELGEVGVVRAGEPGRRGGVRNARGMRPKRQGRAARARPGALG